MNDVSFHEMTVILNRRIVSKIQEKIRRQNGEVQEPACQEPISEEQKRFYDCCSKACDRGDEFTSIEDGWLEAPRPRELYPICWEVPKSIISIKLQEMFHRKSLIFTSNADSDIFQGSTDAISILDHGSLRSITRSKAPLALCRSMGSSSKVYPLDGNLFRHGYGHNCEDTELTVGKWHLPSQIFMVHPQRLQFMLPVGVASFYWKWYSPKIQAAWNRESAKNSCGCDRNLVKITCYANLHWCEQTTHR